jgi:tetratricopeptide (TPR) repeat protein
LREASRSNPSNPLALGSLASFIWTRRRDGGAGEAEYYFQRALEADFTNPDTLSSYANFLWRAQNRQEEALDYYQQSIELNPSNFRTLANYSQLLFIKGDLGRACSYAKIAVARSDSKILQLEANFYLYAHDATATEKPRHLEKIKLLVGEGVRSPDWDLSPTVRILAEHGDKNAVFVEALSEVISAKIDVEILEQFRVWL